MTRRSTLNLASGGLGILGGVVLLAAFVVEIDPNLNALRLVLFNTGAIAIAIAIYRHHSSASPRLALLGSAPAVVANAAYLVMTLIATGRDHPFAGDFGFAYFLAGFAMWLSDALLGLVSLPLGRVSRIGSIALGIGSLMASLGMDRLELTSQGNPTIFGPLSLIGIALNGVGWIVLGLDLARRAGAVDASANGAQPAFS
jgi:hypothetical protein